MKESSYDSLDDRVTNLKQCLFHTLGWEEGDSIFIVYTDTMKKLLPYFEKVAPTHNFLVQRKENGEGYEILSPLEEFVHELDSQLSNKDYSTIVNLIDVQEPDDEISSRVGILMKEVDFGKNIGHAPGLLEEMLDIKQDYTCMKKKAKLYTDKLNDERVEGYHIVSKTGTNLLVKKEKDNFWEDEYNLEKREGRGGIANILPGEVYLEKEGLERLVASGRIVFDLTAIESNINFLDEDIKFYVDLEDGFVTNIEAYEKGELNNSLLEPFLKFLKAENISDIYLQEFGNGFLLDKSSGLTLEDIPKVYFEKGVVLILEKLSVHFGLGAKQYKKDEKGNFVLDESGEKIELPPTHGDGVLNPSEIYIHNCYFDGTKELVYSEGEILV